MIEKYAPADVPSLPAPSQLLTAAVKKMTLLDTSASSNNLGDTIIMEAVRRELSGLLESCMVFTVASHSHMGRRGRWFLRNSHWTVSGGTSLLSSRMWFRSSWKLTPADALAGLDVILMGAGWHQYQYAPDPYSRWILRNVLSRRHLHSVRDGYTVRMLHSIGVTNAVNTGCPTLWRLTPDHCARIPRTQAGAVVTTVNSYRGLQDSSADRRLLATLKARYRTVYLWIQTDTDYDYARSLEDGIIYINPSVAALDAVLSSNLDVDYVGNRLHAGIRALQHRRRTIIVEIDNRAREMGADCGLPTVDRTDFGRLERMIMEPFDTVVTLPLAAIDEWRRQFCV